MNWHYYGRSEKGMFFVEFTPLSWEIGIAISLIGSKHLYSIGLGPIHIGIEYNTKRLRRVLKSHKREAV